MKRRALVAALAVLVLGLAPPAAEAHAPWDVYDTCSVEGSYYFYPGGPSQWWHIHQNAPGATNYCHLYTSNSNTRVYNYADWYLPTKSCDRWLPSMGGHNDGRCYEERKYTGTYQVFAHLVRESHFSTKRAHYIRYAFNLVKGGTSHLVDQAAAPTGNKLVVTAYFDTRVDDGYAGFMRVNDYTTEPSGSKWIGVDRMYFHPVE